MLIKFTDDAKLGGEAKRVLIEVIQNDLNRMKSGPEPTGLTEVDTESCAYVEKDNCIISGLRELLQDQR